MKLFLKFKDLFMNYFVSFNEEISKLVSHSYKVEESIFK